MDEKKELSHLVNRRSLKNGILKGFVQCLPQAMDRGSPEWEFRLSQNQVILHPGFKCCCVIWDNTTREMLLPHQYTVSEGVSWTCSKAEQNWFIKELAVVIDAEVHGVFYFHIVSCVLSMVWQPRHQVCCNRSPLRYAQIPGWMTLLFTYLQFYSASWEVSIKRF